MLVFLSMSAISMTLNPVVIVQRSVASNEVQGFLKDANLATVILEVEIEPKYVHTLPLEPSGRQRLITQGVQLTLAEFNSKNVISVEFVKRLHKTLSSRFEFYGFTVRQVVVKSIICVQK